MQRHFNQYSYIWDIFVWTTGKAKIGGKQSIDISNCTDGAHFNMFVYTKFPSNTVQSLALGKTCTLYNPIQNAMNNLKENNKENNKENSHICMMFKITINNYKLEGKTK